MSRATENREMRLVAIIQAEDSFMDLISSCLRYAGKLICTLKFKKKKKLTFCLDLKRMTQYFHNLVLFNVVIDNFNSLCG